MCYKPEFPLIQKLRQEKVYKTRDPAPIPNYFPLCHLISQSFSPYVRVKLTESSYYMVTLVLYFNKNERKYDCITNSIMT